MRAQAQLLAAALLAAACCWQSSASAFAGSAGNVFAARSGFAASNAGALVQEASAQSTAVPQPDGAVRVATWNVRNYMASDRHYDGRYRRDYPKPEVEKAALQQILLAVRPDVLVLQEIGSGAYLRELQADLKRQGLDYPFVAMPDDARAAAVAAATVSATTAVVPAGVGERAGAGAKIGASAGIGEAASAGNVALASAVAGDDDDLDELPATGGDIAVAAVEPGFAERSVAVLSRIPWDALHTPQVTFNYLGRRRGPARPVLEMVFESADGVRWSLFTLHLKSRYTTNKADPEGRILRTAEATAIRNDLFRRYPPSSAYPYLIAGDFNDLQDSAVLRRFLVRGKHTLAHAVSSADSRGEIWTYYYAKQATYQRIDYILASPAMYRRVQQGHIADMLPQSRVASDHRLLYLDVHLAPPQK